MFEQTEKSKNLQNKLLEFMDNYIYPNEKVYKEQLNSAENRWAELPIVRELKNKAKDAGLWNLFISPSHSEYCDHDGLTYTEYAPLAEIMGRVIWSAEVFNCSAPDTGNMEVLMDFGTKEQKEKWLYPLLNGEIRSGFAMTEPQVASSDATNIELSIERDGNEWVLNGRKWFTSGAMYELTKIFIVMGKTAPDNPERYSQQSQILVPKNTPGLKIVRPLILFGYDDAPSGHAELLFDNVRVPVENILLGEGRGFEIGQSRLGPGRMHHCMRLIGSAQRALEITCDRVTKRTAFGQLLQDNQSVREDIAESFTEVQMMRLLAMQTCYKIDQSGVKSNIDLISATKVCIPAMVQKIVDRCMQIHGGGGLTEDYCLADAFQYARCTRLADGPDQVHKMSLGKKIIKRYASK